MKQKLMDMIIEEELREMQHLYLIMTLLDSRVAEFDVEKFARHFECKQTDLFRTLLKNCRNLSKIKVGFKIWSDIAVIPRARPEDLFPIMAANWPNLRFLNIDIVTFLNYKEAELSLITLICENLPQLQ
jgi:hypothetical protein